MARVLGRSVGRSFSRPPGFVPPLLSPQLNHLTDGAITSIVWNGGSEESSVGRNGGTLSLSKQEFKFPMLAFFESINFELTHLKVGLNTGCINASFKLIRSSIGIFDFR